MLIGTTIVSACANFVILFSIFGLGTRCCKGEKVSEGSQSLHWSMAFARSVADSETSLQKFGLGALPNVNLNEM